MTLCVEWKHEVLSKNPTSLVERWEHWPDPQWRWAVLRHAPRVLGNALQHAASRTAGHEEEEHWSWSVSFQGGDFDRWHGADQWMVGDVCFSEEEAKAACERVGPVIHDLWASMQPRKN